MKRSFRHLTPRYVFNRLKLILYEIYNPDKPWLTKDSINLIDQLIKKSDVGLEFGSGRSTSWFLKRLSNLISIETNELWYEKVKDRCKTEIEDGRLSYLIKKNEKEFLNFIQAIETESIDFVLIDGAFRDICAVNILDKIKKSGVLVIDNINWYIFVEKSKAPIPKDIDYSNKIWKKFLTKTKSWRYIHTTDGITDTGIWIKK